ncbi:MAG: hypothetical protein LAN62_17020 [Acidobacteriia bacterium]|nr:hypothetical protein [Terriglobia bacterium]
MDRKLRPTVVVLFTAVAAVGSFTVVKRLRMLAQAPARKPFTAVMVEKQYAGDSSQASRAEVYLRAFRSDGSQVTVQQGQSPRQEWKESKVVLDLTGKKRVTVDQFTESLTTYRLTDGDVSYYRSWPNSECSGRPELGQSTLLGYEVRKVEKQLGGETHLQLLMAPALGCFELQETYTVGPGGTRSYRVTREALYVIEGEPPPGLFEIPASYAERAPSEVSAEFVRRYPEHKPPFSDETAQGMDEVYQAHR